MPIGINTEPLKALDVPTRWLLSTALRDAAAHCQNEARAPGISHEVMVEIQRKYDVYREIATVIEV